MVLSQAGWEYHGSIIGWLGVPWFFYSFVQKSCYNSGGLADYKDDLLDNRS